MLTPQENALFTQVGPGTKMGELLRRFWHPVGVSDWVTTKPQAVKVLGEDLVIYRTPTGVGLVERRCAHRRVNLDFGRVEGDCIRCPYHGWLYDSTGRCVEQPAEPEGSNFKDKVQLGAYQTQEAGGVVFGYLGPAPAPLLPLYDTLLFDEGVKIIQTNTVQCNWFQMVENIPDLAHLPWLHGGSFQVVTGRKISYHWEPRDYGFDNVMLMDDVEDIHRSSYCFPYVNRFTVRPEKPGGPVQRSLMYRVPLDDVTTRQYLVRVYPSDERELRLNKREPERGVYQPDANSFWGISPNDQDRMAVEQQGLIMDRDQEHLSASDAGITKLRQMMREALAAVAAGEDPQYVIRDPARQFLPYTASATSLSIGHREFSYSRTPENAPA
jgi:5,5'-dehydrodivanillate O-demethylase oxygenase subunit